MALDGFTIRVMGFLDKQTKKKREKNKNPYFMEKVPSSWDEVEKQINYCTLRVQEGHVKDPHLELSVSRYQIALEIKEKNWSGMKNMLPCHQDRNIRRMRGEILEGRLIKLEERKVFLRRKGDIFQIQKGE